LAHRYNLKKTTFSPAAYQEYDELFFPIIFVYVQQYHVAQTKHAKAELKGGLKDTLKKWTNTRVSMVSEGVMKLAKERGVDPFVLTWPHRKLFNADLKGKSEILWEHTTPLEEAFSELIQCNTKEQVWAFMKNYSGVCWVTREEDNRLNASGYKSKRPDGWQKCYGFCGIKIIPLL